MEIRYQKKIVAYVDVLGFSNIVYSQSQEPIAKYFHYLLNSFKQATQKNKFNYFLISDSIVLTSKFEKDNLEAMIRTLCKTQAQLLGDGILLRGAISFGDLYLNKSKNIIVGSGLINAFKLESQAIYPRIILDKRFIKEYYDGTLSLVNDVVDNTINLLLFNPPESYLSDYPYLNYTRFFGFWHTRPKYYNNLIELFKNNYYKNDHIDKYEWLKRHLLISINERLIHLKGLPQTSYNVRRRVRLAEAFMKEFQKL